jgi:methionyl-tRNA formyltransferase
VCNAILQHCTFAMFMALRIIYLGTPDFAVASLDALVKNGCNIVGVITAPDKPSGRGLQLSQSAVKQYAVANNLHVLQPTNLKDPAFLDEVRALKADLQIVVAFRMMPEALWDMPPMGTFNLHASLLPQYRGAAPINHAIINGEKETGVTTFFLKHVIDTGDIIFQERAAIGPDDNAGILHDKLMEVGAGLVVKTVQAIEADNVKPIPQDQVAEKDIKHAPKIFRETCKIDWAKTAQQIHNHVRGLSPYPAAYTIYIGADGKQSDIKVYSTQLTLAGGTHIPGTIETDNKSYLKVFATGGYLDVLELQAPGKRRMKIHEYLAGNKIEAGAQFI